MKVKFIVEFDGLAPQGIQIVEWKDENKKKGLGYREFRIKYKGLA